MRRLISSGPIVRQASRYAGRQVGDSQASCELLRISYAKAAPRFRKLHCSVRHSLAVRKGPDESSKEQPDRITEMPVGRMRMLHEIACYR